MLRHVNIILVTICLLFMSSLYSQLPGTLDPAFGNGGIVLAPTVNINTSTKTILIQADGKIVVAGETFGIHPGFDIVLARFHPDGFPDSSFGVNGISQTETNGMTTFVFSTVLLPDGKFLVAGSSSPVGTTNLGCCFLARFTNDGTLDGTFGNNGFVYDWITDNSEIYALALQADGKILASGSSQNVALLPVATTVRYDSQGQRDSSFGSNGVAITQASLFWCQFTSIEWMPDGRILAAGSSSFNNQPNQTCFLIARYFADGTPDPSFGDNGIDLSGKFGLISFSFGLKLLPDGKIILAGRRVDDQGGFTVARYLADGGLDPLFGINGSACTAIGNPLKDLSRSMTVQPDGKILLAGITYPPDGSAPRLAVIRYNQAGALDDHFGENGISMIDIGQNKNYAYDIVLQNDGKILVTSGYWQAMGSGDLSLARFMGGDPPVGLPSDKGSILLKLYPNPVSELLEIEIPKEFERGVIEIHDLAGILLMNKEISSTKMTLDIRNLAKGIYLIRFRSAGGTITSRFCKNG